MMMVDSHRHDVQRAFTAAVPPHRSSIMSGWLHDQSCKPSAVRIPGYQSEPNTFLICELYWKEKEGLHSTLRQKQSNLFKIVLQTKSNSCWKLRGTSHSGLGGAVAKHCLACFSKPQAAVCVRVWIVWRLLFCDNIIVASNVFPKVAKQRAFIHNCRLQMSTLTSRIVVVLRPRPATWPIISPSIVSLCCIWRSCE